MKPIEAPNKKTFLWVNHKPFNESDEIGSDIQTCKDSYISVTPLNADLTFKEKIADLEKILK